MWVATHVSRSSAKSGITSTGLLLLPNADLPWNRCTLLDLAIELTLEPCSAVGVTAQSDLATGLLGESL